MSPNFIYAFKIFLCEKIEDDGPTSHPTCVTPITGCTDYRQAFEWSIETDWVDKYLTQEQLINIIKSKMSVDNEEQTNNEAFVLMYAFKAAANCKANYVYIESSTEEEARQLEPSNDISLRYRGY